MLNAMDGKARLTRRQQETLSFLERFIAANGYPPTVRQVCVGLGLSSTQTAYGHLCKLEQKGYVRLSHAHRTIQLLARGNEASAPPIPLVGRVAAGQPLLATENVEGHIDLGDLAGEAEVFALRVKGDSMIEAGILDGDYILVRQQEAAENGEIVVALLRDEATVKFFYREQRRVRLQPANAKMKPIFAKEVTLIGKVIAVLRSYGPTPLIK